MNPVVQLLARKSSNLRIEPCRDWEQLSALFQRHRPAAWLTADRSAAFLEWRYGPSSPNHPVDIYSFRDARGNEGWFALGHIVRGREAEIHGRVLMDAVWPRERMTFQDIFPAIVEIGARDASALFLQPRPGVDYGECSRWIVQRRGIPRIFAVPAKGGAPLTLSLFDFVPADGDSAFRISVWPGSF